MRYPTAVTIAKRIIENSRATQRARLAALQSLPRAPMRMLLRLLADPTTPGKLVGAVADRYAYEVTRHELRTQAKKEKTK